MLNKIRENKIFKIVFKIIECIVFIMIGLYVLLIVFQKISNNSSLFGVRVFTVASNSMKPVYEIGDVIVIKDFDSKELKIGDDITYLGSSGDVAGKIVTHRIIEINDDKFTLQGVANPGPDPVITANQIYGKVVYKTAVITFISTLIRNQYGFFFLIFIPLVVIIFLEVVDTINDLKNKKNEE